MKESGVCGEGREKGEHEGDSQGREGSKQSLLLGLEGRKEGLHAKTYTSSQPSHISELSHLFIRLPKYLKLMTSKYNPANQNTTGNALCCEDKSPSR